MKRLIEKPASVFSRRLKQVSILAIGACVSFSLISTIANGASKQPASQYKAKFVPPPLATKNPNYSTRIRPYSGTLPSKRISLNFSDIQTRKLLQILAQFTNLNFVVSDNVTGTMSIHLKQVPWSVALKVILQSQGLGQRRSGNIILVAPLKELTQQEVQVLQAKEQLKQYTPLRSRILNLRYANAEDIGKLLTSSGSSILSKRGSVSVDKRTNSIWVRDIATNLRNVVAMIKRLDHPVKQVMIEARIVSIQKPFERQLGARFGITQPDNLSGTIAGANQLAQGTAPANVTPLTDRLNFDLPVTQLFSTAVTPGSLGLAVAKLGNNFLDLELSALEQEGTVRLISTPRLITSDREPAYIQTGEEIPYQAATSSGATSVEFKQAVLSLKVLPQITRDNRILLKVTVSNNRAGTPVQLSGGGSAIPINTEEEQSTILVNNKQTIVLGGVYRQDKQKVITRVPFFGQIPLLGYLFRHTKHTNDRREILIFLTPYIVHNPSQME